MVARRTGRVVSPYQRVIDGNVGSAVQWLASKPVKQPPVAGGGNKPAFPGRRFRLLRG